MEENEIGEIKSIVCVTFLDKFNSSGSKSSQFVFVNNSI